jgi:CheY-like chemotaxis protein
MLSGGTVTITKADFSQLTILVIDDSDFVRRLVLEMLSGFGVGKILLAESAQEAFARMEVTRPDLIICDWRMHPVDGLAVLRKLRLQPSEDYPRIPFIMLTGHNSTDDVTTAIGEGADSYIVKPFSSATLMTHLLKVILADKGHLDTREAWAV